MGWGPKPPAQDSAHTQLWRTGGGVGSELCCWGHRAAVMLKEQLAQLGLGVMRVGCLSRGFCHELMSGRPLTQTWSWTN